MGTLGGPQTPRALRNCPDCGRPGSVARELINRHSGRVTTIYRCDNGCSFSYQAFDGSTREAVPMWRHTNWQRCQ